MPTLVSILSSWWSAPAILTIAIIIGAGYLSWKERHEEILLAPIYWLFTILLSALIWAGYGIVLLLSLFGRRP